MTISRHQAYIETAQTALSTELNSLANNTMSSASSSIDNTSNLALFMDVELVLAAQGTARSTGAVVELYLVGSLDGTNFDSLVRGTAELLAVFPLDNTTAARRRMLRDIPIPPGLFQLAAYNATGQAFASSGNTIRYRRHSIDVV